jgi:hypothetical protein
MKKLLQLKQSNQSIIDTESKHLTNLVTQLNAQYFAIDRGFGGDDLNDVIKATHKAITKCNHDLSNAFNALENVNLEIAERYKADPDKVISETGAFNKVGV